MTEAKVTVKSGETVPESGIYVDDSGRRATMVKGEPAPPTSKPGEKWSLDIPTHPKS